MNTGKPFFHRLYYKRFSIFFLCLINSIYLIIFLMHTQTQTLQFFTCTWKLFFSFLLIDWLAAAVSVYVSSYFSSYFLFFYINIFTELIRDNVLVIDATDNIFLCCKGDEIILCWKRFQKMVLNFDKMSPFFDFLCLYFSTQNPLEKNSKR